MPRPTTRPRPGAARHPRRRPPLPPRTPLDYLIRGQPTLNPALALSWELSQRERAGTLDLPALLALQDELTRVGAAGETCVRRSTTVLHALMTARTPQPDRLVPEGF
ncbi:MAG: hypothetical protein M3Z04_05790 [Chloroflexota bacterium]|nr:hypothetical protein [Chloroflexota bacterium]